ncbi:MAG: chemotaxis protein CheW [Cyanobacteriota bacterium]|nr:chemotaxis protein CheW [Cyanobacteriota bacterium]
MSGLSIQGTSDRLVRSHPAASETSIDSRDRRAKFLQLQLGSQDTTLIGVDRIVEITTLELPNILPVPQMPSYVLGIHNWRGEMLWLVDLSHLLGFPPLSSARGGRERAMVVVLQFEEKTIGMVMSQVMDIEQYDLSQMHARDSQLFSPQILPFVQGFFIEEENEVSIVLDVPSIFSVPQWRSVVS